MFTSYQPILIHCQTPVHPGKGSDVGIIDLPIQRERHTEFPKIESSSLKGPLRNYMSTIWHSELVKAVFGPESGDVGAGATGYLDARILLFPVRSVAGIFAYLTCPYVLARFFDDLNFFGWSFGKSDIATNSICNNSQLVVANENNSSTVIIDETPFSCQPDPALTNIAGLIGESFPTLSKYWQNKIKQNIIVVDDNTFTYFVTLGTELITRIKIDYERGTVQDGALWYEEYLPAETILYSCLLASKPRVEISPEYRLNSDRDILASLVEKLPLNLQLGGNKTNGKGHVLLATLKKENQE